jgi:hypothetical protein
MTGSSTFAGRSDDGRVAEIGQPGLTETIEIPANKPTSAIFFIMATSARAERADRR